METMELTTKEFGNSIGLVLSKRLGIKANETYLVHKNHDGSLTLTPKIANPFLQKVNISDQESVALENVGVTEFDEETV